MSKKHGSDKKDKKSKAESTAPQPVLAASVGRTLMPGVTNHTDAAHGNPMRPQDSEVSRLVDHNYLREQEFTAVSETLQRNVASTISLYLKFKKFHWDIRGRLFRELHLAYDEMAEEVFASIDVLAERLVMLGGSPVAAPIEIERYSTVRVPVDTIRDARDQLRQLVDDHTTLTARLRQDSRTCDDAGDPATADIYNGLLHEHDKHRWMLQAMLDDPRLD